MKMYLKRFCIAWLFCVFVASGSIAQNPLSPDYSLKPMKDWECKFEAFQFKTYGKGGHVLPYRFYMPDNNSEKGTKYPLVIFFHGAGEKGFDNRSQFQRFNPTEFWKKYPCYVLAPECPERTPQTSNAESVWVNTLFGAREHQMAKEATWPMQMAISLIQEIMHKYPVDDKRVYVTGLSMGGFATWEIMQRKGTWFAAAIPVCGGGDPNYASKIVDIPIWAFHGSADRTVPVECSRYMIEAIRSKGGNPKYTEYPGVDHDAWSPTYSNTEVWDWLFRQKKN